MSASEIERTLVRLAHEIVEKNSGAANVGLVGSNAGGSAGAAAGRADREDREASGGCRGCSTSASIATTFPRLGPRPTVTPGAIGFDVNGRDIVLMDDVLYTGRTIRAAL